MRDCIFDQSHTPPDKYDEAIDLIHSAKLEIYNTAFINIGKTILAGNGDFTEAEDKQTSLYLENCIFDGCSRRNPYLRYGSLEIESCIFKNWGKTFYLKTQAIRLGENCRAKIKNSKFIMDNFIQTSIKNFFSDWIHQFTGDMFGLDPATTKHYLLKLIFNSIIHPIKFIKMSLPGPCKGIICEHGATTEIINCSKNHWWIFFLK